MKSETRLVNSLGLFFPPHCPFSYFLFPRPWFCVSLSLGTSSCLHSAAQTILPKGRSILWIFWLSWAAFRVLTTTAGLGGGRRWARHLCTMSVRSTSLYNPSYTGCVSEAFIPLTSKALLLSSHLVQHIWTLQSSLVPASSLAALPHPFPPVRAHQMWFLGRRVCCGTLSSRAYVCPLPWCSHLRIFVLWDSS